MHYQFRKKFFSDRSLYYNSGTGDSKRSVQAEIDNYASKIKTFDSTYKAPKQRGMMGVILQHAYMALMTVLRYGHLGVFVIIP